MCLKQCQKFFSNRKPPSPQIRLTTLLDSYPTHTDDDLFYPNIDIIQYPRPIKSINHKIITAYGVGGSGKKADKLLMYIQCCAFAIGVNSIGQTCTNLYILYTLFSIDSRQIIHPVWDREVKEHTLSGCTSPYKPYKGVPPRERTI